MSDGFTKTIGRVICVFHVNPSADRQVKQARSLQIPVQKARYSARITNETEKILTELKLLVSFKKEMVLSKSKEGWGTRPIDIGETPQLGLGQSENLDLLELIMKSAIANSSDILLSHKGSI